MDVIIQTKIKLISQTTLMCSIYFEKNAEKLKYTA